MKFERLPVSVVICSRNRARLLADTVDSICNSDELPREIIVVDQSDAPAAPAACGARPCEVRYLPTSTRGSSRGRNLGGRAARCPLLVFTDDDMQADPRWLRIMVRNLVDGGPTGVVTGRVLAGPAEVAGGFVPALVDGETAAVFSGRLGTDVLAGGNMGIHRSAFIDIGGFDERLGPGSAFPAAEDNDLGFRLLEAGFHIRYAPDAVLYHRAWRSMSDYLPLRHAYGRGKGGFYVKHARRDDGHMLRRMARDLLRRAVRAPRRALHPRLALGELAYAAGVVRGAFGWLRSQDNSNGRRDAFAHD